MNQKQLIEQLKTLKEIKPRKDWAVLLKSQILSPYTKVAIRVNKQADLDIPVKEAKSIGIMPAWPVVRDALSFIFAPQKLAFASAVLVFLIVGLFGFATYTVPGDLLFPIKKLAEQSQAALTRESGLKQNIVTLNNRINDLAMVAKEGKVGNIPSAISEISANALELANNLKSNSINDPQVIKDIATNLKTLANVPGTDLSENQNVKDLYQTVVESQIADLQKTTLTDDQQKILLEVEELCIQGKYTDALEKILLINK